MNNFVIELNFAIQSKRIEFSINLRSIHPKRSCERIHPKKLSSGGRKENFLSAHARFH